MDYDYDLFVIGGGSGGVRAARMSARHGARVAVAEEFRFGGTCVIRGCVPKKLMVYASAFSEAFEDAAGFGWTLGEATHDWPKLIAAKDAEITRLEGLYAKNLDLAGVELHRCRAEVTGPNSVKLASYGREVTARHILIATGGAPFVPDFPGSQHAITSNEVFDLPRRPERLLIVGGGYVACEFAGVFNGLGTQVTQVYRGEQVLRGFDREVRDVTADAMRARGVDLTTHCDIQRIDGEAGGPYRATLDDGRRVEVDAVMLATGRVPNTQGLGLESAGVPLGPRGEVVVDRFSATAVPSIHAVGDVTDRMALTPVAIREGAAFADTVFGGEPTAADHALVATAIFTQPEIGTVGLGEDEAREAQDIDVYKAAFRPMMNTISGRDERMLMKLIVAKADRKVLGCHVVGHGAGEIIQMAAIAVKMGATKEDFDRTVAVHPTASEELVTMKEPAETPYVPEARSSAAA
ncbi:MAG: glutathione-disulfide reductase [Pseudomonadota bacterium]